MSVQMSAAAAVQHSRDVEFVGRMGRVLVPTMLPLLDGVPHFGDDVCLGDHECIQSFLSGRPSPAEFPELGCSSAFLCGRTFRWLALVSLPQLGDKISCGNAEIMKAAARGLLGSCEAP